MDEERNKSSLTGFGDLIADVTTTPEDENDETDEPGKLRKFQVNKNQSPTSVTNIDGV